MSDNETVEEACVEQEVEDDLQGKSSSAENDSGIEVSQYKIGKKEREELYTSVLYTIKHKLGANSSEFAEDLYDYAQIAFGMSNEEHQRYLQVVEEEKPPIPVLNITVVEADGLEGKDANGLSDPYCMLGIQPISDRGTHTDDRLSVKFIRTTSVKPQTRSPKWNEKFRLDIDDIQTEKLHLDIWDHDDDSSVFDSARKLNEVSSLKGLGRFFKEIAQSARTSTGDKTDDFLGCVNLRLEVIPTAGIDDWFFLEGRTDRSTVQGRIRLKMGLGTREDSTEDEEKDNWKEVVEHMKLLSVFIQHEVEQDSSHEWTGELAQSALTILHQHAIQGNITELQQALCRWIMYSKQLKEVPLDYASLYKQLKNLRNSWGDHDNPLSREEEAALAESFIQFLDYCLIILQKHRDMFPVSEEHAQHNVTYLLKCLSKFRSMQAFKQCCPTRQDLHVEISNSIKKGTLDWFNTQVANAEAQQMTDCRWPLRTLLDLVNVLNNDIYKGYANYHKKFESSTGVSFSVIVYKQLEEMLGDTFGCRIQEACTSVGFESEDTEPESEYMSTATTMFELFMALQEFVKFREKLPKDEEQNLTLCNYYLWFKDAVQHWFVVAESKARVRLEKAVELDKMVFLDSYVRHSTSAVDAATCFVQVKEFWRQLNWPDPAGAFNFVSKVIEIICEGCVYYAVQCQKKVKNIGSDDASQEVMEKHCVMVNNIEWVVQKLTPLEQELEVEQILERMNLNHETCTTNQSREPICEAIKKAENEAAANIQGIICGMVERMRPDLRKLVFQLAWAPEILDAENAIRPLMEQLDATLHQMYGLLTQPSFSRLLEMMWSVLVHELKMTTLTGIGKEQLYFFERLHASLAILVDFFHGSGNGLSLECIQSTSYQNLFHMLKIQKSLTPHLIEMYVLQKIEEQEDKSAYGVLTVKASYNKEEESLHVEILNAKELVPLDKTAGVSDPYVIVDLVPHHFFPDSAKQRTKVQKRTLYPLFDEAFDFPISLEQRQREGASLLFSVMDHDMITKNDFEGEAYLPLCDIPGSEEEEAGKLVGLGLIHPDDNDEIIVALAARTSDKEAQEFLKNLKHRRSKTAKKVLEKMEASKSW